MRWFCIVNYKREWITYLEFLGSFVSQGELCDGLRGADGEQVPVGLAILHDESLSLQFLDVHSRRITGVPVLQVTVDLSERRGGREHQQGEREHHFDTVSEGAKEDVVVNAVVPKRPFSTVYKAPKKGLQILLSRTQAGPGRTGKQEQEQISRNHVQTIFGSSVQFRSLRYLLNQFASFV